jgi:epoxyqueuosine reductase QueG
MPRMRREQGRLREELRLRSRHPDGAAVVALARALGFHRAGIVDPRQLAPWAERMRALLRRAIVPVETQGQRDWEWILAPDSWSGSHSVLVCCLSCFRPEPEDLSSPGNSHALIAPFARAHYYRAAIGMLRVFGLRLEEALGIPRRDVRFFSNSRLPEKPLLAASGIGTYGKNGLSLVPGLGSQFIIAGAVLPLPSRGLSFPMTETAASDPCGSCTRCMKACPAGAILEPGVVDPSRCLQGSAATASVLAPVFMERWGVRLYGCQDCQTACPHNRDLTEAAPAGACGEIGPSVALRRILSSDGAALKGLFKGTAMGMSWVSRDALLRNALVAAGNRRDPSLRAEVEGFSRSQKALLRKTADWALPRIPVH